MIVRSLKLNRFRNYDVLHFTPAEGLSVLVGENGQGKSNLLEAIYLLATTRSLRAGRESELVLHGEDSATIQAQVDREREPEVELDISVFSTDKKTVRINGVKKPRVLELLGQLNVVFFGGADVEIVSGEPSNRRRYLNIEISQISPKYVFDLAGYKKVLEQRNRLLKDVRDRQYMVAESGLDAWSDQLVKYGSPLIEKRRFFLERLAPIATGVHRDLTDGSEELSVIYQPSVPIPATAGVEAIEEAFRDELNRVSKEEARRGLTLVGPQRDDVLLTIDGKDARAFASQGQQRTIALSLKLAQFQLMQEYVGEPPIMLLDDVMSDLDDRRRAHLLKWVQRKCQTILTCTSTRSIPRDILAQAQVFTVTAGAITKTAQNPTPPQ